MTAPTLAAWLLEQIAADEYVAERAASFRGNADLEQDDDYGYLRVQPRRVLAECEAKRAIVERYTGSEQIAKTYDPALPVWATFEIVLRILALPYADRPGYDEGWRP